MRHGVFVICDVCGQSILLENSKDDSCVGWVHDDEFDIDICQACMRLHKKALQSGMSWMDIIELFDKILY